MNRRLRKLDLPIYFIIDDSWDARVWTPRRLLPHTIPIFGGKFRQLPSDLRRSNVIAGPSQVPDHIKIAFSPVFVIANVSNTQNSGGCSAKQLLSGRDSEGSRVPP